MSLKSELLEKLDDVRKHLHASEDLAVSERNRVDEAIVGALAAAGSMVDPGEPVEAPAEPAAVEPEPVDPVVAPDASEPVSESEAASDAPSDDAGETQA